MPTRTSGRCWIGRQLAYDSAYETVVLTTAPAEPARSRNRGDGRRQRVTPTVVRRLGCLRGISTLTGFGLAVEIGDWRRFTGSTIGAFLGLVPSEHSCGAVPVSGVDHQDRGHPCPPAAGRSRLAPPPRPTASRADDARPVGTGPAAARTRGHEGNRRLHQRWQTFTVRKKKPVDRQRRRRPRARRLGLVPGHPRVAAAPQDSRPAPAAAARGTTREPAMNNHP